MDFEKLLAHYREDVKDEDLVEEAIATLEKYFKHMDKDELLYRNRPMVIAYLALKKLK